MPVLAMRGSRSVRGEGPYRILDIANWCDFDAMGCTLTGYPDITVYHFVLEQIQPPSGYEILYRPSHQPVHPRDWMGTSSSYLQWTGWLGFPGFTPATGDFIVQDWEHHSKQEGRLSLRLESRLRVLAALQEDWNSYGAAAVDQRAVARTREILRRSLEDRFSGLSSPGIAAGSDGGLSIEWGAPSHNELIVDVPPVGALIYLLVIVGPDGREEEREGSASSPSDLDELFSAMRE